MADRSDREACAERLFAVPVLIAALVTIPVVAIEQPNVGEPLRTAGSALNWSSWLVFLAQAVTMLIVAENRWRWAKAHLIELGLVVFTPPLLPAGLQSLRAIRLLRLLRLIRVPELMRGLFSVEGLRFAGFLAVLTAAGGAAAFQAAERKTQAVSFSDSLWWAITTMTTVGYGDITPMTGLGRIVAVVVMLVGIGVIALVTGAVAQRFLREEVIDLEHDMSKTDDIEDEIVRELGEIRSRLNALEALLARR